MHERSPVITHLTWGRMRVDGLGEGKDFKLWPGGGRGWDWDECGTRHDPGIQPGDVEELLEHHSRIVVLSRGMLLRLRVPAATVALLEERGVRVMVAETSAAAEVYNELAAQGQAVGGLFHSTC